MRAVDGLKTYTDRQVSYNRDAGSGSALTKAPAPKTQDLKETAASLSKVDFKSTDKIINPEERDFFVKMFPDSSSQIEKHVLFNRNGRLQVTNISKGMIIDGRV